MIDPLQNENLGLTLGQQLKNAREKLNLSLDKVSSATALKRSVLESLENDIFILPNIPPAFVRGYVRNYLRFLRLPENLANLANYGEVSIPKVETKSATVNTTIKRNEKSQRRWVQRLTYLILFVALGMTFTWWWQGYQKDQENRDELVSTSVVTEPESTPMTNEIALTPKAEAVVNTMSESTASTTVANEIPLNTPTPSSSETVSVQPAVDVPVVSEPPKVEVPMTETVVANEANSEQPAVVNNDELRIELTGQSWVTVKTKNKRLAEKLYNEGEVLSFNNNEQYRLTIGAPANVKIYYKGQEVPLKVDGRVARIRLPLASAQ